MKRKRCTEEQINSILKEHEASLPVGELARRWGVVENTIYRWQSKFGGNYQGELTSIGVATG